MTGSTQHVQIPHNLGGSFKLKDIDFFIYGELKRYMDWKTYETFVAQSTLADSAKKTINTISASLKRLQESGEIDIIGKRGRSNIYKIKKDGRMFEMISYDLINSEIFDPELKGFYYRYQEYCFKDQDGFAKCTYTNEELSELMSMDVKTIRSKFKQLETIGILSTALTKVKDPRTGLMRDMRMVDLAMVCQFALYTNERVDVVEKRVEALEKTVKTLMSENKRLNRELYKQNETEEVEYEML